MHYLHRSLCSKIATTAPTEYTVADTYYKAAGTFVRESCGFEINDNVIEYLGQCKG